MARGGEIQEMGSVPEPLTDVGPGFRLVRNEMVRSHRAGHTRWEVERTDAQLCSLRRPPPSTGCGVGLWALVME